MSDFQLLAVFLALVSVSGWINTRWLHWPMGTVMVVAGLLNAGLLLIAAKVAGGGQVAPLISAVQRVDFPRTVMSYMLALLLFAGAMQVDLSELRRRRLSVWSLATLGVFATTAVVGLGMWGAAHLLGLRLPLPWALVFGALISPTDPTAVMAAVREGQLSKTLEALLQGEALLNDGAAIVVFTAAVDIAAGGAQVRPLATIGEVFLEAAGGFVFGLVASALIIRAMRAIDNYSVEVTLSLALAVGIYAAAQAAGVSAPIAVASAGLVVGDRGFRTAMSDTTRRYVRGFWTLVDEILNAILFLLLGLEAVVIPFDLRLAGLAAVAVALVLAARFAVVLPWGAYFWIRMKERHAGLLLGWGGLHGAVSLALALGVPRGPDQTLILSITFVVVIFSVVVQGLTFGRAAAWVSSVQSAGQASGPEPRPAP